VSDIRRLAERKRAREAVAVRVYISRVCADSQPAICYRLLTLSILRGHPRNWPISPGVHFSRSPAGCDRTSLGACPEAARWRHLSRDRPVRRQKAVESFPFAPVRARCRINQLAQAGVGSRHEQIRAHHYISQKTTCAAISFLS